MKRIVAIAIVALSLAGCRLGDLLSVPNVVWTCIRWQTATITVDGQTQTYRVRCLEEGYVRRVDTVAVVPRTVP